MIFRTVLITPPTDYPVSYKEASDHLRDIDDTNIPLITLYRNAAVQSIESELISLQLMPATYELQMDDWISDSSGYLVLPKCPLISITSVKYDDISNVEQPLASSNYQIDSASLPGQIRFIGSTLPAHFDKPNAVRIRYVAGYATAALVPFPLKAAILLRLGQLNENRQDEENGEIKSVLSVGVQRLIAPYRIPV
jgi:uncharacterized phiE125 gp8 family phage protein